MSYIEIGKETIKQEANALSFLAENLSEHFSTAVEAVLNCTGIVVPMAIGKPWFVAQKFAATLASTGTRSFGLHPADAGHGDLGKLYHDDLIFILSNSGQSKEICNLLPAIKQIGSRICAITGNPNSMLAENANIVLSYGAVEEACPLGLAPSTSTTVMLALTNAISFAVSQHKGFSKNEFAKTHPLGSLGRKLMPISTLMGASKQTALCTSSHTVMDALHEITKAKTGAAIILENKTVTGIFTDGDLRRVLDSNGPTALSYTLDKVMTKNPITFQPNNTVEQVIETMISKKIDEAPVVNGFGELMGYIDLQYLTSVC